ncbi:hypothetical protein HK105_205466 [Polyrhizophydium stewartii]|uniref:Mitochondrial carrier n=1 Tax=Polyrhizophydium stewartii TaxID=2732419 RepID=A0ABR4N618_9FUNG|nr:hypothetical protein HK105_003164 [Polyrhizophydium stewartii]
MVNTLAAACVASLVTRIATHPVDTIKSRLQVGLRADQTSLWTAFARTIAGEGFWALYQGLPITLLFSVPGLAVYLGVYDAASLWLAGALGLPATGFVVATLAATAAEMLSALFWTPMEIIKTRQQVASRPLLRPCSGADDASAALLGDEDNDNNNGSNDGSHGAQDGSAHLRHPQRLSSDATSITVDPDQATHAGLHSDCGARDTPQDDAEPLDPITPPALVSAADHARAIYAAEGVAGFFKGYWLGLAVFIPYSVVYFVVYEQTKAAAAAIAIPPSRPPRLLTAWDIVACSALSSGIAALVSNVFDVAKTRWQAQAAGPAAQASGGSEQALCSAVWRGQSFMALVTAGAWARVAWAVPSAVISFTVYESLKAL